MKYVPVLLDLRGRACVVVGGGSVAERKIRHLLKAGADITVISPDVTPGLRRLVSAGLLRHAKRTYRRGDAARAFLVIAATADPDVNRRVSREVGGLVNAVDMPDYCSFIMPSVTVRGHLAVSVSTSGVSPAFARALREEIERHIPRDVRRYLSYLASLRKKIIRALPGDTDRARRKRTLLLKKLGNRNMLHILATKGFREAKRVVDELVAQTMP